jgi:hypothetical protein
MSTINEIWLTIDGHRAALDLDQGTLLLPTFQSNDRTSPSTLENDYSPEFSVPGTTKNHRLLKHAAASQNVEGAAYSRVPCILTSGGVETLPQALLYIKGYGSGRYTLQLTGGNRRLVDALKHPDGSDKKLSDLDLSRFDHYWLPDEILPRLSHDYFEQNGWGYELYDRGKAIDLNAINPYDLYPSLSKQLVWQQLLTDAGFTADSLMGEEFWVALTLPSANAFTYSQEYRDARTLQAGFTYDPQRPGGDQRPNGTVRLSEFPAEKLPFGYTQRKPYRAPTAGATFQNYTYTADTHGYYDLLASVPLFFSCRADTFGEVSCKVILYVNGQPVHDAQGNEIGLVEKRGAYFKETFSPKLSRFLLKPGDTVALYWQGDEWRTGPLREPPQDAYWAIGPYGGQSLLPNGLMLATEATLTVRLLEPFPEGGLIKLQDWLPDMTQINFLKSVMVFMGLTVMTDAYEPHLKLSPGSKLLQNIGKARNWTAKRDAVARPGRLPERALTFRFGNYAKVNNLLYEPDDNVTEGYGDGTILIKDEVLPDRYELAKLPFAATEKSPDIPSMLRILNFEANDLTATPPTYTAIRAKPRITLKNAERLLEGQLIMVPATDQAPAQLQPFTTSLSFFESPTISLLLDDTVLSLYWSDLRAMLDRARYLVEKYRLTAQDITELDFSVPVYDKELNDFFVVCKIAEFDARRPVEVTMVRLNPTHLPPPMPPGGMREFYGQEFYAGEFY